MNFASNSAMEVKMHASAGMTAGACTPRWSKRRWQISKEAAGLGTSIRRRYDREHARCKPKEMARTPGGREIKEKKERKERNNSPRCPPRGGRPPRGGFMKVKKRERRERKIEPPPRVGGEVICYFVQDIGMSYICLFFL